MESTIHSDDNLDHFLASIESKLRGPFSSSDLAKTIYTTALRDNLSPHDYLEKISSVISKADKITQIRVVIALLGLLDRRASASPSSLLSSSSFVDGIDDEGNYNEPPIDHAILDILDQTQEAPAYDEWVRVCAALVQGIVFIDDESGADMMGSEAKTLLDKTASSIMQRVQKLLERNRDCFTDCTNNDNPLNIAYQADNDPLFAPYRYALLNRSLLSFVIPEAYQPNVHFIVNPDAEILQLDARLETAKANEEKEHDKQGVGFATVLSNRGLKGDEAKTKPSTNAFLPGTQGILPNSTSNHRKVTTNQRPKSSLFIVAKRPAPIAGKAPLHVRKAGAAQALLMKGRGPRVAPSSTTFVNTSPKSTSTTGSGRATSLLGSISRNQTNSKSKMMVMDVNEVRNLNQQRDLQQNNDKDHAVGTKRKTTSVEEPRLQKISKKSISSEPASTHKSTVFSNVPSTSVPSPVATPVPTPATALDDDLNSKLVSATLSAYQAQVEASQQQQNQTRQHLKQQQQQQQQQQSTGDNGVDWEDMLKQLNNRLNPDDRRRINLFYLDKVNPTPDDQSTHRIKLHEERTVDPSTGLPIKETYYLDLDYTSFSSKQSKKIKRYSI